MTKQASLKDVISIPNVISSYKEFVELQIATYLNHIFKNQTSFEFPLYKLIEFSKAINVSPEFLHGAITDYCKKHDINIIQD